MVSSSNRFLMLMILAKIETLIIGNNELFVPPQALFPPDGSVLQRTDTSKLINPLELLVMETYQDRLHLGENNLIPQDPVNEETMRVDGIVQPQSAQLLILAVQ